MKTSDDYAKEFLNTVAKGPLMGELEARDDLANEIYDIAEASIREAMNDALDAAIEIVRVGISDSLNRETEAVVQRLRSLKDVRS